MYNFWCYLKNLTRIYVRRINKFFSLFLDCVPNDFIVIKITDSDKCEVKFCVIIGESKSVMSVLRSKQVMFFFWLYDNNYNLKDTIIEFWRCFTFSKFNLITTTVLLLKPAKLMLQMLTKFTGFTRKYGVKNGLKNPISKVAIKMLFARN